MFRHLTLGLILVLAVWLGGCAHPYSRPTVTPAPLAPDTSCGNVNDMINHLEKTLDAERRAAKQAWKDTHMAVEKYFAATAPESTADQATRDQLRQEYLDRRAEEERRSIIAQATAQTRWRLWIAAEQRCTYDRRLQGWR